MNRSMGWVVEHGRSSRRRRGRSLTAGQKRESRGRGGEMAGKGNGKERGVIAFVCAVCMCFGGEAAIRVGKERESSERKRE